MIGVGLRLDDEQVRIGRSIQPSRIPVTPPLTAGNAPGGNLNRSSPAGASPSRTTWPLPTDSPSGISSVVAGLTAIAQYRRVLLRGLGDGLTDVLATRQHQLRLARGRRERDAEPTAGLHPQVLP